MKRASKVFSVVFKAVYLVLFGFVVLWIISRIMISASSTQLLYLNLGKIPEGTVFADVLAKGDWNKVRKTNIDYEDLLGVDQTCEIAQYDKDGYKSLMFNADLYYTGDRIDSTQPDNKICFEDWSDLFKELPYIKVAYCDKDGNILGITEEKHITPVFMRRSPYNLYADGEELSYKLGPLDDIKPWILFIAMTIFGIVYKIYNSRRKKKLIQSGETDNERKE